MIWLIAAAFAADALPDSWTAAAPEPQTYAATTRFDQFSSCSQSWALYQAKTAMVLTLEPGGRAHACREKRSDHTDPDRTWRTEDRLGMVGRWSRDGAWITLTLRAKKGSCEGPHFSTRPDPDDWHLRCTRARTADIPGKPLVCRFTTPVYNASLGFELFGVFPAGSDWIVLGDGAGLSIVQDDTGWGASELTFTTRDTLPTIGAITAR